jgi:3-oxoacyl-[acyl-carrier protein] reductase
MDLRLKNKRVLIQGSSSGLGFAIAKAYASEGAIVAIASRDSTRITEAANAIPGAIPIVSDLTKQGAGTQLVKQAIERLGGIDILITNTGGPPKGYLQDLHQDDWERAFQNLWMSAVESIQEALLPMKNQKWGRILLSTSTDAN